MANLRHRERMEVKAHAHHDRLVGNDADSVRNICDIRGALVGIDQ